MKVTIKANAVTSEDVRMLRGASMHGSAASAGTTAVGIVVEGAPGSEMSTDATTGDQVLLVGKALMWTSSVIIDRDTSVVKIPLMPAENAARLPDALTAYALLTNYVCPGLSSGDTVLQTDGDSSVGRCVAEIAASMGAKVRACVRFIHVMGFNCDKSVMSLRLHYRAWSNALRTDPIANIVAVVQ
jgi:NADPH:quinone reductase-like Zn-dependent oxidoreductase